MKVDNWTIERIITSFGLYGERTDLSALEEELKAKTIELHPDKGGGDFASEEQRQKFLDAKSALEFLRSRSALVPLDRVEQLIKTVEQGLMVNRQREQSESKTNFVHEFRVLARRHYFGPKLTSGIFAGVFGAIFSLAPQLQNHPVLGVFVRNVFFVNSVLVLSVVSAFLFLATWIRERSQDATAEFLVSDEGLFSSFSTFCNLGSLYEFEKAGEAQFFKFNRRGYVRFLIDGEPHYMRLFIRWGSYRRRPKLPWEMRLNSAVAERLAEMHLARLQKKNVVVALQGPDIDDWYSIQVDFVSRFQRMRFE